MYEIASGNIVENIIYQVTGGTSVVYDGVTYASGAYFVGVSGVATYTKTDGNEIVVKATRFTELVISRKQPAFTGMFPENTSFKELVVAKGDVIYYFDSYTTTEYTQDDPSNKNIIPSENKYSISYSISELDDFQPQFTRGLTYAELEQLEIDNPGIVVLTKPSANNISQVQVNGINFKLR